jgi:hypothetical protein
MGFNLHRQCLIHLFIKLKKNGFPEKNFSFSAGPNKKKEKIGTIFCPKGGLAVIYIVLICILRGLPRGNLYCQGFNLHLKGFPSR